MVNVSSDSGQTMSRYLSKPIFHLRGESTSSGSSSTDATAPVHRPPKGSQTTSPAAVQALTILLINSTGFWL